jgi:hypothetical protein
MPAPERQREKPVRQAERYSARENHPEAAGASYQAEYAARGKATDRGMDLAERRSPHRTHVLDLVGSETRQPTSLRGIADQRHRFRDLYRGLHVERLLACGGDLNQEAASGVDGVTRAASAEHRQANVEALVEWLQ